MFKFEEYIIEKCDDLNFRCYVLKNNKPTNITYHRNMLTALLRLRTKLHNKSVTEKSRSIDSYINKITKIDSDFVKAISKFLNQ